MAFGEIVSNTLQVIAVGVLLGAGLPALFACGIKLLDIGRNPASAGAGAASADGTGSSAGSAGTAGTTPSADGNGGDGEAGTTGGNRAAQVGGYAIFAAIVVVVLYAILFVVKSSLSHYLGIELPI